MKRRVLPVLCLLLLTACAEGATWGEWFPEEKKDENEEFFCSFLGNCPPPKSDACAMYGNCPDKPAPPPEPECDFYGNCKNRPAAPSAPAASGSEGGSVWGSSSGSGGSGGGSGGGGGSIWGDSGGGNVWGSSDQ